MIWDQWKNFEQYPIFTAETMAAIREFQNRLTPGFPVGSYPLLGERLKVSIFDSETAPEAMQGVFEIHRQFADLQTLLAGDELAYVRDTGALNPRMEFDEKKDYQLFDPNLDNTARIVLNPKNFVVYLPEEAHLTSVSTNGIVVPLHKVVYKIHQTLIKRGTN